MVVPLFGQISRCHFFIRSEVVWDFKAPQDRWNGMFPWDHIMTEVIWMVLGVAEGVVDQRTQHFDFCANFLEAFVSSFEDTWSVGKQYVPSNTAHLMLVWHISLLLQYAMLHLIQITTVNLNFWNGSLSQLLIMLLNPNHWFSLSRSNGLDLVTLGFIKGNVFPFFHFRLLLHSHCLCVPPISRAFILLKTFILSLQT